MAARPENWLVSQTPLDTGTLNARATRRRETQARLGEGKGRSRGSTSRSVANLQSGLLDSAGAEKCHEFHPTSRIGSSYSPFQSPWMILSTIEDVSWTGPARKEPLMSPSTVTIAPGRTTESEIEPHVTVALAPITTFLPISA